MKLFVPPLGTILVLSEPWTFKLYYERRNKGLGEVLGVVPPVYSKPDGKWTHYHSEGYWERYGAATEEFSEVTLPAGTKLKVDRIYIRKGADDYSSLSFMAHMPNHTKGKRKWPRFWAKLDDVNRIEYDLVETK